MKRSREAFLWHALIECRDAENLAFLKVITEEIFSTYGFSKLMEHVTPDKLLRLFLLDYSKIQTVGSDHDFMKFLKKYKQSTALISMPQTISKNPMEQFVEELRNLKYELAFWPIKFSRNSVEKECLEINDNNKWCDPEGRGWHSLIAA